MSGGGSRMPWARGIAVLIGASLSAACISGCASLGDLLGAEPVRDDTGEVVEGGESDAFDVTVGDCLGNAPAGQVSEVSVLPCDQPHDSEVYHDFRLEGVEYPGDREITERADEGCLHAFEDYIGVPYQESALEITYYTPTRQSWEGIDDRLVSCLVSDPSGPVSGSLEGAGR